MDNLANEIESNPESELQMPKDLRQLYNYVQVKKRKSKF